MFTEQRQQREYSTVCGELFVLVCVSVCVCICLCVFVLGIKNLNSWYISQNEL